MVYDNQGALIPSFRRQRPPGYASVRPSPTKPGGKGREAAPLVADPRLRGGDDLSLVVH